jgi:hypothetical protein
MDLCHPVLIISTIILYFDLNTKSEQEGLQGTEDPSRPLACAKLRRTKLSPEHTRGGGYRKQPILDECGELYIGRLRDMGLKLIRDIKEETEVRGS